MEKKLRIVIRQVDAWGNKEDGYTYNETWDIGEFFFEPFRDERRAFIRALNKLGIRFKKGTTRISVDGEVMEVIERATGRPLFAAVYMPEHS